MKIGDIEDLDERALALKDRVLYWQVRLMELGVGHWWIDRISMVDKPFGNDSRAGVWWPDDYDRCIFEFSHEAVTDDPIELDRTIIHEWLHVAFRDYDTAVEAAEDLLAPQTWEVLEDRIDHEKEGLIDRLAFLIERIHRTNC